MTQIKMVMRPPELCPTFPNQTNQSTEQNTRGHCKMLEKFCKLFFVSPHHNKKNWYLAIHWLPQKEFISSIPEFNRRHKTRYLYHFGFISLHFFTPFFLSLFFF